MLRYILKVSESQDGDKSSHKSAVYRMLVIDYVRCVSLRWSRLSEACFWHPEHARVEP